MDQMEKDLEQLEKLKYKMDRKRRELLRELAEKSKKAPAPLVLDQGETLYKKKKNTPKLRKYLPASRRSFFFSKKVSAILMVIQFRFPE